MLRKFVALTTFAVMLLATSAHAALVGQWSFDDGVGTAAVGSPGPLITWSTTTPSWGVDGGRAAIHVTTAYHGDAAPGIDTSATWTVSFWARKTVAANLERVWSRCVTGSTWSPGAKEISLRSSGIRYDTGGVAGGFTATATMDLAWHHWAIVQDTTQRRAYRDGILIGTETAGPYSDTACGPVTVSRSTDVWLDDLRVYDHAQTLTEIQADMATPVPPAPPTPKLIPSWTDASGAANNGETHFNLERTFGVGGSFLAHATVAGVPGVGSTVTFVDTGVTEGQTYCYRVNAENAAGVSAYSNTACGTYGTPVGTPTPAGAGTLNFLYP